METKNNADFRSLTPDQRNEPLQGANLPYAGYVPSNAASTSTLYSAEYFKAPVRRRFAELPILACSLLSGLVDGTMFAAYNTFALMQSGNTIFLGLSASGLDTRRPYGWLHSFLSIICFTLGALFFSRLNTLLSPAHQRRTLALSFSLQTLLVIASAALVQSGWVDGSVPPADVQDEEFNQLLVIALLSFQASGQIIATHTLDYGELSTVVVTGLLCDLWRDPALFAPLSKNAKRNRRAAGFVLMLLGAIAGGWICRAVGGVTAVLWVAAGLKGVISVAWCFWPAEEEVGEVSPA